MSAEAVRSTGAESIAIAMRIESSRFSTRRFERHVPIDLLVKMISQKHRKISMARN